MTHTEADHVLVAIGERPAVPGEPMPLKYTAYRWHCSCGKIGGWRNAEGNARRGHTLHVTQLTKRPALISVRP